MRSRSLREARRAGPATGRREGRALRTGWTGVGRGFDEYVLKTTISTPNESARQAQKMAMLRNGKVNREMSALKRY